jgi:hypothetical protein
MSMRYDYFNGFKYTIIKVKDGETKTVDIEITTISGELTVYVAKDNDTTNAVFFEENIAEGSYSVDLTEAGKFTIKVIAAKHKGSFIINW